jgi:hypothetical protein
MAQTDQVLKVDAAGRVWTPRARREEVLDEFERSGMAVVKFAAFIGVKYPTLASWVQKRRRQRNAGAAAGRPAALRWVEAAVAEAAVAEAPCARLRVELPGGARIEIADEAQAKLAAVLLRALAAAERRVTATPLCAGGAGC